MEEEKLSTGKLRMAFAAIFFVLVILFDVNGKSLAGISTKQLFKTLETDYGKIAENWVATVKQQ